MTTALQRTTVGQAATVTDIRYQQVLDNMAMLSTNPSIMPYYAVVSQGLTQVEDMAGGSGSLTWGWTGGDTPASMNQQMLGLTAQRTKTGNWTLDPLHDPDRLKAMRCVYQSVLGVLPSECADCAVTLHHFQLEAELAKMPVGWFHVGCKKAVPKQACYVGQYGDMCVWVMPDGVEGLTQLSLIILDIATVDLGSLSPTKSVVRKYDGNCKRVGVEVTETVDTSVPDCDPENVTTPARPRKQRREIESGLRSQIFGSRR